MTGAPNDDSSRREWARHLGALTLFTLLTAVMAFPLVRDPVTSTAGGEGDNAFCIRQFWWMKHAIVDLGISPFRDPTTYYPVGHAVTNGELFPATTFPAIPITMLWGPVVAYNVTLLLTFVLTGFGTYLWTNRLTGSTGGAIVAGIVAAFLPYRFAHVHGHLHMVSTHWVPFAFLAFDRFLDRKSAARAAVFGVCAAMVALSSWYYAYAAGLMLPLYALVRSRPWREHWTGAWWRGLAIAAMTAAVLVLPFLMPYLQLRSRGGLTRGIVEMEFWSINFYDFMLPNLLNPLWRGFVERWFPVEAAQWVERGMSLGYTALTLSLVAVALGRRHRAMPALFVVAAVSFAIALGPTLHSGDRQILLPVPLPMVALAAKALSWFPSLEPVRAQILAQQTLPIPMPSMFLFVFVPMTTGMRVMARFGVWTGLMTAVLAGWGVSMILNRLRERGRWLPAAAVTALAALVLLESYSQVAVMPLRPRAVDVWLSQQPPVTVVELPLEQASRPLQDYYKTVHGQRTVFGPIGDGFMPPILKRRRAALADFPSEASVAAMRAWGVNFVLLTPSEIPDWPAFRERVSATPGLRLHHELDGVQVWAVH